MPLSLVLPTNNNLDYYFYLIIFIFFFQLKDEGKVYFFGTFSPAKKPIKEPISIEPEGHKIISCSCANNQVFLLTGYFLHHFTIQQILINQSSIQSKEFGKLFRFCDASPASEFTNSIKQVDELFGKYVKHIASDTNFSMALVSMYSTIMSFRGIF